MSDDMIVILFFVGLLFVLFLFPRIFAKVFNALWEVGRKAIFKKQIAESDDLIDVPLVLTSSATPQAIIEALDAIIKPSKEPPGFGSILYQVSREPMRVVYAMGSKLQPQQLVTELRLSERDGKTEIVFRVLAAMRSQGLFIYKESLIRLREQVKYVAECGTDEARLAEGAYVYRALEPEVVKRQTAIFRVGSIMSVAAMLWLAVGIPLQLLPVWLLLAAGGGTLVYLGRKPLAKREREGSAEAARVLHPVAPAAPAPVAQQATAVPVTQQLVGAQVAPVSPAAQPAPVAPVAPVAAAPAVSLPARFAAMRWELKLAAAIGTVVVMLVVGAAVFNSADSGSDRLTRNGTSAGDFAPEPTDVGVESDPEALSPDTHARMEDDLYYSAPADGSMEFSDVVFASGEDQEDGTIYLEFTLVSRSPAEWYIAVLATDMGYYIDYDEVSLSEYLDAINGARDAKGMIVFNNEAVYELHVFTQGQKASASTPEKDQVTIVPDHLALDLPYAEWEELEFAAALEAHDAAVKQAFADVGLIAVLKRVPVTDGAAPTQSPPAESAVPVGTKVYITIPSSD